MHKILAGLLWLGLVPATFGDAPTALVDPRPASHVLDQAALLRPATLSALDALAATVASQGDGELMVVTVLSSSGMSPRQHATAVFNHFGIGHAPTHRGVLLWVAPSERAAELVLGDGLDTEANRATAANIMQYRIVPAFKAGDPDAGVLAGSQAVLHELLAVPTAEAPAPAPGTAELPPPDALAAPVSGSADSASAQSLPESADEPGSATPDLAPAADAENEPAGWSPPAWLTGGGIGAIVLGALTWLRRWLRYRPRTCRRCRSPMVRLSESDDDAHLGSGERKEEQIRSVDYDIWLCRACGEVEKLRYGAWFTSYAKCPQCQARTKSSTETTLVAATYDHGGRVRVNESCVHCHYRNTYERSTPRLTRSSSSSSGGRSFGGGRSSGGGASGRW